MMLVGNALQSLFGICYELFAQAIWVHPLTERYVKDHKQQFSCGLQKGIRAHVPSSQPLRTCLLITSFQNQSTAPPRFRIPLSSARRRRSEALISELLSPRRENLENLLIVQFVVPFSYSKRLLKFKGRLYRLDAVDWLAK